MQEIEAPALNRLLAVEEAWLAMPLTGPQLQVMFLAVVHGDPTGPQVQQKLGMLPSTLTRVVDRLVERGLIVRQTGRPDRRIVHYVPTEAGRALVLGLFPGQE